MLIRPVQPADSETWERMRQALWPSAPGEHASEIRQFFRDGLHEPIAVLLALDDGGQTIGFAELSIRSHAEGCHSDGVGYLEGWFVEPSARRKGVGAALIKAAEEWARDKGCTEFASDAVIENTSSAEAHKALGFEEVDRIVCFRKAL